MLSSGIEPLRIPSWTLKPLVTRRGSLSWFKVNSKAVSKHKGARKLGRSELIVSSLFRPRCWISRVGADKGGIAARSRLRSIHILDGVVERAIALLYVFEFLQDLYYCPTTPLLAAPLTAAT